MEFLKIIFFFYVTKTDNTNYYFSESATLLPNNKNSIHAGIHVVDLRYISTIGGQLRIHSVILLQSGQFWDHDFWPLWRGTYRFIGTGRDQQMAIKRGISLY